MDPFSLTVGIASIASVFQTCLHGYRTLNTAMAIGDNALTLNVQFRVEELRLYLWGRNWGLVEEPAKAKTEEDSGSDSVESSDEDEDKAASAEEEAEPHSSLDLVDEDLEIPGLRDLTIEVLGRIQKTLDEWKSIGQRYGAAPGNKKMKSLDGTSPDSKTSSKEAVSRISSKQSGQEKEISDRTKLATKLRWAIKDKTALEELLVQLTNLNDSLEKLLPRRQRASLARGLAGEILNVLEGTTSSSYGADIDEQLGKLSGLGEAKAAQIVSLKRSNYTEKDERVPTETTGKNSDDVTNSSTPFSKPMVWADGEKGSMQIPFESFVRLPEPKIQYYEVQKATRKRWITGKYVPLQRSLAIYTPTASISSVGTPAQATLIEWRPTAHESRATELSEEDLKDRRDHIARLLHRTSATDAEFRVLDCMGYTISSAHTPDGATHGLVGYVYRYPEFATPKALPVTLRDLLGEAYNSDDPKVPSLEERFKLARNLAIALYQLQCAGWVHRKISSYNIIFFRNRKTEELDLGHPFLVGWQYSRPDDQRRLYPSEGAAEGIGDLDMYVHRARLSGRTGRFPRFRKSFDIYSLGVVLMEIAFWEPILALTSEDERSRMSKFETIGSGGSAKNWWKAILKTAEKELAPEMGTAYRDAVLFCLNATGKGPHEPKSYLDEDADRNPRDPYFWETGFEEIGIEKDFYWSVLKPLEKFGL